MLFEFNIKQTDDDYLEFNKFWMLHSHYGKKQIKSIRVIIAVMWIVFILISLFGGGFTLDSFIGIIPYIILLVLFEVGVTPFVKLILKTTIKNLKKSGKMGYSPKSTMEFYDGEFIEKTDENETRQKYTAIERVSIVAGKNIYIHINNLMAYILPWYCFDDDEQRAQFIEFIKAKCETVDVYK